jgi:hypothetical protein
MFARRPRWAEVCAERGRQWLPVEALRIDPGAMGKCWRKVAAKAVPERWEKVSDRSEVARLSLTT